jgi:ectoine hydroxylase-related dioxygenase (phytanoyl-CoA dioxygenase family)
MLTPLTQTLKQTFDQNGYVVAPQLFNQKEVDFYIDHYMRMNARNVGARGNSTHSLMADGGKDPGDWRKYDLTDANMDPLSRYPRMLQMHRNDPISLNWLLEPRINEVLTLLLGREPYAVQTMIYFKPPKARGQALHQDNYYLRVKPGTCIAAWMALDDCDVENGCLQVVPRSQNWDVLCTIKADTTKSFTEVTVPVPEGTPIEPVPMKAGDVLFFNGQLVHGSYPNTSANRFRRSLIAHYIEGDSQQVASWYKPTLRMDGSEVTLASSGKGTACGVWVDTQGRPMIEVNGYEMLEKESE